MLKFSIIVAILLLGQAMVGSAVPSATAKSFNTATCAWEDSPQENVRDLENMACSNDYQSYVSPADWNAGIAFFAYCDPADSEIKVRELPRRSPPDCSGADYIGISEYQYYCGSYAFVARKCSRQLRTGFVIINRAQLDAGVVEATACPVESCTNYYHEPSDEASRACPVPQPDPSNPVPSITFDSNTCAWSEYTPTVADCTLPFLGSCALDQTFTNWISPVAWQAGQDFFMYCDPNGLIRYRFSANKGIADCATAEYIGVSPLHIRCGSKSEVMKHCHKGYGYVMIKRQSLDDGVIEAESCRTTREGQSCAATYPWPTMK